MIEVYDECKKAIANNKCSECNEYYSCYLCDYVEERYQQGRTDAINEFGNWLSENGYDSSAHNIKAWITEYNLRDKRAE